MMNQPHPISREFKADEQIVICQDDTLTQLKKLPSNAFKLVVSSPPYNIGKVYEKQVSLNDYLDWQKEIVKEMVRITTEDGSIVWQVGNYVDKGEVFPLDIYFYPLFKELGMRLRNRIVWHFDHGLHASNRFSGRYEVLLWFTKGEEYTFNLDAVRVPAKYPGKLHYKGDKAGQPSGNPLGKNPSDSWQSDLAYVADFAEVDSKAWLLELNAASTSGLYRVSMQNLMPALRAAAIAAYAEVFEG